MAAQAFSVPSIAIELNTGLSVETAEAYSDSASMSREPVAQSVHGPVEDYVREYFKDIPVMVKIAYCESHFTQVDASTGSVIRGRVNPLDVGVMQINERYHAGTAAKLDLNLYKLEDNLAYARHLYEREGTRPWSASSACWHNATLAMR